MPLVETVHNYDCFAEVWSVFHWCISANVFREIYQFFLYLPYSSEDWQWEWFPMPAYLSRCTSPRSSQFLSCESRYVKSRWKRSWIPSKSFLIHLLRLEMLLLCLSFSVPSTTRSPLFDDVVRDWENIQSPLENVGWIRFPSRDVHKCNRLFIGSNEEGILSIALLELFRITRITLHCLFHKSSLLIRHWMGCGRYFAASRLEVHLDEDDSRSSSRAREHGSFLLVSQLHVAIQALWSQCFFLALCEQTRWFSTHKSPVLV